MIGLTPRQADALRFIIGFQAAHDGASPSFREIADGIGLSGWNSKSAVNKLLGRLQERGAIRRRCGVARAIEVLHPLPIPRLPDGEPLYFVRTEGALA